MLPFPRRRSAYGGGLEFNSIHLAGRYDHAFSEHLGTRRLRLDGGSLPSSTEKKAGGGKFDDHDKIDLS